jgi:hypothetical protein
MASNLEKRIRHQKQRKGMLVPLLEDLFQKPVEVENQQDINFITMILQNQVMRSQMREDNPLFSPSQLSECLRYVYLLKNRKELGLVRVHGTRIEPNFYFFNGNFLHLKWQFALHKLDKHLPDEIFKLYGVEVPIVSKRKDHGGTVDALCSVYNEPVIVDFKGLNVRTFTNITFGNVPESYLLQLPDYAMLYNSQRNGVEPVSKGLLIAENKGGPSAKYPVALYEHEIPIELYLPNVRSRLKKLRKHDEDKTIPPPECVSTQTIQFQACSFRAFCRKEVKAIQHERTKAESRDTAKLKVATPAKPRRSGTRSRNR